MEFSWTTFFLEIINFLVLLWILKRFFYKPVMNAIAQRRAAIDKTLSDAKAIQADAETLKQQYQNRLADWEREKEKLRLSMLEEINVERRRLMTALQSDLEKEREKNRVLEERRVSQLRREIEEKAVDRGGQFVSRLLSRLAGSALEESIGELFVEDLPQLPATKLQAIRAACREANAKIKVASVYPIGERQRNALIQAFGNLADQQILCEFAQDQSLTAGWRISVGPWALHANLRDELKFFSEATLHGS